MLKNLKGLVTKMCAEEYAHRFLIAIFDTVDDTVLVSKCVLKVGSFFFKFASFCICTFFIVIMMEFKPSYKLVYEGAVDDLSSERLLLVKVSSLGPQTSALASRQE